MSNPRTRGLVIFGIILFVAVVFCGLMPFVILPSWGMGIALPVITVPGEVLNDTGWFGGPLVNTMTAIILADIVVLLFAFFAWRASRGWTKYRAASSLSSKPWSKCCTTSCAVWVVIVFARPSARFRSGRWQRPSSSFCWPPT